MVLQAENGVPIRIRTCLDVIGRDSLMIWEIRSGYVSQPGLRTRLSDVRNYQRTIGSVVRVSRDLCTTLYMSIFL